MILFFCHSLHSFFFFVFRWQWRSKRNDMMKKTGPIEWDHFYQMSKILKCEMRRERKKKKPNAMREILREERSQRIMKKTVACVLQLKKKNPRIKRKVLSFLPLRSQHVLSFNEEKNDAGNELESTTCK